MKTIVETFIVEETQELIYDNEKFDQWNDLVNALGLKGQTKICAPEKSPIPFLPMKRNIENAIATLCPVKVGISDYDKSPIPVEILSLVSLSLKEGHFQKVEIWYDDKMPDPACIGLVGEWICYDRNYSRVAVFFSEIEAQSLKKADTSVYNVSFNPTQKYLIGRWGDVKMNFAALIEKAKELFKAERKNAILTEIKEAQRKLEDLDIDADRQFGTAAASNLPF
jgi:hypothetical protein